MAGTLTIDTLKASSGVLATQNGMTGIAKAWVTFIGSTAAIQSSFNVSSVTRNATGTYVINFSTALPNASYSTFVSPGSTNTVGYVSMSPYNSANTTSAANFACFTTTWGALADPSWASFSAFSA